MTNKRFNIKNGSSIPVFSIYTKEGKELSSLQLLEILNEQDGQINQMAELLNNLHHENQELRKELKNKKDLKHELGRLIDISNGLTLKIESLENENRELEEENKRLKKGVDVPIPYVENSMRRLRAEHKVDEQQATIEQKDKEIKGLEEKIQRIYVNVCSAMSEVIDDE